MKHTFLFEEGEWKMVGNYYDNQGNEVAVTGINSIKHESGVWYNKGIMTLACGGIEFKNNYEILPFFEDNMTTWMSFNPGLGRMTGTFSIVDDSILSRFKSEDGSYTGVEVFIKKDDHTYQYRGVLLNKGEKMSSWSVTLKKEK